MYKRKQASPNESTQSKRKTDDEIWRKVFLDAQGAYNQSMFQDAIALFTRALSMQPNHATILDCRSACYERIADYPLAMADAKRTIRVAPSDARGYLRAGKILSLQKRYKGAIKAYDHGLNKVSPDDKRYNMIVEMKSTAERAIAVGIDYMTILPYDIKAIIFSYLSFDRRVQAMSVSRTWRDFALTWGGMWRDLDFTDKKISHQIVKRYMTYAQGRHVRRLALSYVEQPLIEKILKLVISEDCQYLETLELKACHPPHALFMRMLRLMGKHLVQLNMDGSWGVSTHNIFDEALKLCPNLRRLSILGVHSVVEEESFDERVASREVYETKVEELRISIDVEQVSRISFTKLLRYFPHLRLLQLNTQAFNFNLLHEDLNTHCPQLESLTLNFQNVIGEKPLRGGVGTRLRHFDIRTAGLTSARYLIHFLSSDRLETLVMANCTGVGSTLSSIVLSSGALSSLRTLHLTSTLDLNQDDLITVISACTQLEDLKITQSQGVTDTVLDSFPRRNQIKNIDLSQSMHLTGLGLKRLVDSQKGSLKKVIINNCHKIQADAVAWAIEQLENRTIECRHTVKRR